MSTDTQRNDSLRRPAGAAWSRALATLLWAAIVAMVLAGGLIWGYSAWTRQRIFPGVYVLGTHVGGLTRQEALHRLEDTLSTVDMPYVAFTSDEREWLVSADDLGLRLDIQGAVGEAWQVGRAGVFRYDLATRARLLWYGYRVVPACEVEPGMALVALRRIARQVGSPSQRGQIWVAGLQARTDAPEVGRDLDVHAASRAAEQALHERMGASGWLPNTVYDRLRRGEPLAPQMASGYCRSVEPVRVPLRFVDVLPPLTEVEGAAEQVQALLSAPLTLTADLQEFDAEGWPHAVRRTWAVDQATLASWLTLTRTAEGDAEGVAVGLDEERIAAFVADLGRQLERSPREGRFDYAPATGTLTVLSPGQIGYSLDQEQALQAIVTACLQPGARSVALPLRDIPPRVARQDLEALLPLSLISVGETSFAGSTADRRQNIREATSRFHGVVVPPGRSFSFLDHLGPVTVADGYSQSWIIYGDRTILGPGGGVCQVSTTAFRAAFWGGYPIEERWPHSYRVSWYEPPLGLDAAVFSPGTDMRFRNDTDTPILILTEMDEAHSRLYFRFYGAPPQRTVTMEGPETARPVPAGPPVVVEDPSLPSGARVVEESAHDGIDSTIYRVVEEGGVVRREEFFSRYVPWPARYRVGP